MKTNILLLLCLGALSFFSCRKVDAPEKDYAAKLNMSTGDAEPGEEVTFANGSTEGLQDLSWNFGDGTPEAKGAEVRHAYSRKGTFTIRLRGKTPAGVMKEDTRTLVVGERYLARIVLNRISFLQPDGHAWHYDGSGPDVRMEFNAAEPDTPRFHTATVPKMRSIDLKYTFNLGTTPVRLEKKSWEFRLVDAYFSLQRPTVMKTWRIDMKREGRSPIHIRELPNYDVELHYELR